jgi:hypothetical protein
VEGVKKNEKKRKRKKKHFLAPVDRGKGVVGEENAVYSRRGRVKNEAIKERKKETPVKSANPVYLAIR